MTDSRTNAMLYAIKTYVEALKELDSQRTKSPELEDFNDVVARAKGRVLNFPIQREKDFWQPKLKLAKRYVDELFRSVINAGLCAVKICLTTKRKTLFGWGFLSLITEVGLSWDPILDLPVIRGSTVKGIVRDSFSAVVSSNNNAKQLEAELFGDKTRVGKVIFFDAYPVKSTSSLLSADIITPHYTPSVENEYEVKPNPVKFLAVNEGVTFAAIFAFKNDEVEGETRRNLLKAVLLSAKTGWGRRTTRGYGELEVKVGETRFSCP